MNNDKRVRINKRMVAWSNGQETHLPPSIRREVDVHSSRLSSYYHDIEQGYSWSYLGSKEYAEALEYEENANIELERGNTLNCLKLLLHGAGGVLEVDDDYRYSCLDPLLNPPSQANVALFLHLIERCKSLCQAHPNYWPIVKDSAAWSDYIYIRQVYGEYGYNL